MLLCIEHKTNRSALPTRTSSIMKKSRRAYRITKWASIIAGIPFLLFWMLIVALYIPPVQRWAVDTACEEFSSSSGYDIRIGSIHLALPLKLHVGDFAMSRGDTLYAQSEKASLNISFFPLLKGEVELNYISLEHLRLDTRELIPDVSIAGEVGYFRTTARNIDIAKEIANIRQIHLHGADLSIQINQTTDNEEEDDKSTDWVVNLRKGTIKESRFMVSIPNDTIAAEIRIGKASISRVHAHLGQEIYRIKNFALDSSGFKYDKGSKGKAEAPLDHIELKEINLDCGNFDMTPAHIQADINSLTLTQPKGVAITESSATLYCDSTSLELKRLLLRSRNGSSLYATGSIPWQTILSEKSDTAASPKLQPDMNADLSVSLDKRDLGALLTQEQYDALSILQEKMFSAYAKFNGNMQHMEIDSIYINAPTLASLHAHGHLENLNDIDNIAAVMKLGAHADDVRRFIDLTAQSDSCNSIPTSTFTPDIAESLPGDSGRIDICGTIEYRCGVVGADLLIDAAGGKIEGKALYDLARNAYNADITATGLNIARIVPTVPLDRLTLHLSADGEGFDLFSDTTAYNVAIDIDTVRYGKIPAGSITLNANQANCMSRIVAEANDPNLTFRIDADTELHENDIKNRTKADIGKIDLGGLDITEIDLGTSLKLSIELRTDLAERHSIRLKGEDVMLITDVKTFTPKEIDVNLYTAPDSTSLKASNGDLKVAGTMECGYNGLFSSIDKVSAMFVSALQQDSMVHYLQDYQRELPKLNFSFSCRKDNMLANYLAMNGITADFMRVNINMDTINGLNLRGGVYGLQSGELNLDTIRMFTRQENNRIRYFAGVRSTSLNPQNEKQTFNASLYGDLTNDSLSTSFVFRDKAEEIAAKLGAITILKPNGLDISFKPDAIFLNETFRFNDGNFVKIGKGMSVDADVTLSNGNNSGIHVYTTPDSTSRYNANLEIFNIELKEATALIPYAPDLSGLTNLDLHFRYGDSGMQLSADANIEELTYEGTLIGNEIIEAVYFPKNGNMHYLDLLMLHDEEEIVHLNGNYMDDEENPGLDGNITLTHFPLSVTRAFTKDLGIDLSGFINGNMDANGRLNRLTTNGAIQFEGVNIDAYGFGANLHMPDETVDIEDNRLRFKDFSIYSHGDNPFSINGFIDFSSLMNPTFGLRMNANDYGLVNAQRKKGTMLYGKLLMDIRAMIGGSLDNMKLYGDVAVKSKSNITMVMLDAPIESGKELDGLVEFVNFNDTTIIAAQDKEIDLGNINMNLNLKIEEGARLNADLDIDRNNYVTTQGGGNLQLTYTNEAGINMTGRYTMSDGEFKLSLPVIPLKTLNISEGSEASWHGPLQNPTLDITALEHVTSSVTFDDNSTIPVPFDVGVRVTNTLENMGLSFVMSSPENPTVQEQLNALDTETMNRYAVTMLLTGAYAGSSKGMTVGNALSTFIDAKISDIAGTAMKSVSVNVGINDATNAETGDSYKNYSFSFSKRFWNDRVTIVVGGEVNSGGAPKTDNSFINNASLEWKISDNSNRFIKLFYDKNYESILEGEITETGIGYVYKRKLDRLKELFIFRNSRKEEKEPQKRPQAKEQSQPPMPTTNANDSITTDKEEKE